MQLASINQRPPHLVQALEALAQRTHHRVEAEELLQELSGITVLVARKFTNDRTADGLLEAFYLTTGCISLAISQAKLPGTGESSLSFLLQHGAERVFQMGFRHIKSLNSLPYVPMLSEFDSDAFVQERNLKALFFEICRADPSLAWSGDDTFARALRDRTQNQKVVECAQWLRRHHYAGPIRAAELDAHAVITVAVIFAIAGIAPIVARVKQADLEILIRGVRETPWDVEACWKAWLTQVPSEFHPIFLEHMDKCRDTIVRKILSGSSVKAVVTEIQNNYAGDEQEIDYP